MSDRWRHAPDHILRDLQRKTGDDVGARIRQTASLLHHPSDMLTMALSGAGTSMGMAAGFAGHVHGDLSPDQLVDLMWEIMRPVALASLGGSRAELDKVLSCCRPGDGT